MNAHASITLPLELNADGSITLPATLMAEYGWGPGTVLEFSVSGNAVLIRSKASADASRAVVDAALARIHARSPYGGPPITEQMMQDGIDGSIAEKFANP